MPGFHFPVRPARDWNDPVSVEDGQIYIDYDGWRFEGPQPEPVPITVSEAVAQVEPYRAQVWTRTRRYVAFLGEQLAASGYVAATKRSEGERQLTAAQIEEGGRVIAKLGRKLADAEAGPVSSDER